MTKDAWVCLWTVLLPVGSSLLLFAFHRFRHKHALPAGWISLLVGNLLLMSVLLSWLVLMGEAYFRFVYDGSDSFAITRSSARWFSRHYHLNNMQLRDSIDYASTRREGTARITFLGDSFTNGHGLANVDDRFANRVRHDLGPNWEVHVLAVDGFDTSHELGLLKSLPAAYELDVVVLVYCLNDILSDDEDWERIRFMMASRTVDPKLRSWHAAHGNTLLSHSYLADHVRLRTVAVQNPQILNYYAGVKQLYSGAAWDRQRQRLQELNGTCQGRQAKLIVVTFPFIHGDLRNYEFGPVHEVLREFWRESEVPYLDLLPTFKKHADENLVVGEFDAHPNSRAHAIAADKMRPFILKNSAKTVAP